MNTTAQDTPTLETTTMRRVILWLVPFLMVCYFLALLDRVNVGFAAPQMNKDLGLRPAVFGFAASLFFVSYFLVEVPSNLALQRVGARRWIASIMITWGMVTMAMVNVVGLVKEATGSYALGQLPVAALDAAAAIIILMISRAHARETEAAAATGAAATP